MYLDSPSDDTCSECPQLDIDWPSAVEFRVGFGGLSRNVLDVSFFFRVSGRQTYQQ